MLSPKTDNPNEAEVIATWSLLNTFCGFYCCIATSCIATFLLYEYMFDHIFFSDYQD